MTEFVLGFICCELMWFIINFIIDIKGQHKDMKQLEMYNKNIDRDIEFNIKVCEQLNKLTDRLDKIENTKTIDKTNKTEKRRTK